MSKSLQSSLIEFRKILTENFDQMLSLCKYWSVDKFLNWFCLADNEKFSNLRKNMFMVFEIGFFLSLCKQLKQNVISVFEQMKIPMLVISKEFCFLMRNFQ